MYFLRKQIIFRFAKRYNSTLIKNNLEKSGIYGRRRKVLTQKILIFSFGIVLVMYPCIWFVQGTLLQYLTNRSTRFSRPDQWDYCVLNSRPIE